MLVVYYLEIGIMCILNMSTEI